MNADKFSECVKGKCVIPLTLALSPGNGGEGTVLPFTLHSSPFTGVQP